MFPKRRAGQGQGELSDLANKENLGGELTQSPQKHEGKQGVRGPLGCEGHKGARVGRGHFMLGK